MNIDKLYLKGPFDTDYIDISDRYGMYLKWRTISSPSPQTNYDIIPGMNGYLDSTEEFGEVIYGNRMLDLSCIYQSDDFHYNLEKFLSRYHGQLVMIIFDNDPSFYWSGRLSISGYSAKDREVKCSASVYPFKFHRTETIKTVHVETEKSVVLHNDRMKVIPEITYSAPISLTWGNNTRQLSSSQYPKTVRLAGFKLDPFSNLEVTISGNADVTFRYREGAL